MTEPLFTEPNFLDSLPKAVPNVFTPPPFSPMVAQPEGTAWKCPEWMSNGAHTGLMQFNSIHRPFKRKSSDQSDS